jgi:hypothetical protein
MSIALVAHAGAGSSDSNNVTTSSVNTTGANLLVAVVCSYSGSPTLSDSKGNTWTGLTVYNPSNDTSLKLQLYYCASATVGSGHTFTLSSSGKSPSICVAAFSGADAAPLDQQAGFTGSNASSTVQPGSVTPSTDNQLLVTGISGYSSAVSSIDSSFTITDTVAYTGTDIVGALAYKIQTAKGAENPTWTVVGSNVQTAAIATFKASAGGGGGTPVGADAMYHYQEHVMRAAA